MARRCGLWSGGTSFTSDRDDNDCEGAVSDGAMLVENKLLARGIHSTALPAMNY